MLLTLAKHSRIPSSARKMFVLNEIHSSFKPSFSSSIFCSTVIAYRIMHGAEQLISACNVLGTGSAGLPWRTNSTAEPVLIKKGTQAPEQPIQLAASIGLVSDAGFLNQQDVILASWGYAVISIYHIGNSVR